MTILSFLRGNPQPELLLRSTPPGPQIEQEQKEILACGLPSEMPSASELQNQVSKEKKLREREIRQEKKEEKEEVYCLQKIRGKYVKQKSPKWTLPEAKKDFKNHQQYIKRWRALRASIRTTDRITSRKEHWTKHHAAWLKREADFWYLRGELVFPRLLLPICKLLSKHKARKFPVRFDQKKMLVYPTEDRQVILIYADPKILKIFQGNLHETSRDIPRTLAKDIGDIAIKTLVGGAYLSEKDRTSLNQLKNEGKFSCPFLQMLKKAKGDFFPYPRQLLCLQELVEIGGITALKINYPSKGFPLSRLTPACLSKAVSIVKKALQQIHKEGYAFGGFYPKNVMVSYQQTLFPQKALFSCLDRVKKKTVELIQQDSQSFFKIFHVEFP